MSEEKNYEDEEFKEPEIGFFKFENPGDKVTGTYIGSQKIPAKGIYPEQIGYNLLVNGNEMVVALGLGKIVTHKSMKGAKIGQRVKFIFTDWFEQDAYKKELDKNGGDASKCKISRSKTIKVLLGKTDEEYVNGFGSEDKEPLPDFTK